MTKLQAASAAYEATKHEHFHTDYKMLTPEQQDDLSQRLADTRRAYVAADDEANARDTQRLETLQDEYLEKRTQEPPTNPPEPINSPALDAWLDWHNAQERRRYQMDCLRRKLA